MSNVTVYSTKVCPNCKILKQILNESDISFDEVDMTTPAALTELAMNNVFTMSAPVLKVQNMFYTTNDMMNSDTLDRQKVEDIIASI
ncbi:MAG: NrdH-redoxin [ANME-2 cluster archaeon]|nr:NrdH-redoxin [ANME-2 cluster archaeon]MDF1557483.1 glutaredoxin domain-containing protein [ANME-2 cluster archaeon]